MPDASSASTLNSHTCWLRSQVGAAATVAFSLRHKKSPRCRWVRTTTYTRRWVLARCNAWLRSEGGKGGAPVQLPKIVVAKTSAFSTGCVVDIQLCKLRDRPQQPLMLRVSWFSLLKDTGPAIHVIMGAGGYSLGLFFSVWRSSSSEDLPNIFGVTLALSIFWDRCIQTKKATSAM